MTGILLLFFGVLVLSAYFSGAEAVLVSITHAEEETLLRSNAPGARQLAHLRKHLNHTIVAIVIGNNIVNIGGSMLVGHWVAAYYGDAVLAVISALLTAAVILFAEILPKSIGIHYAPNLATVVALSLAPLVFVLHPLLLLIDVFMRALKRGERRIGTEEQILSLVSIGRRAGYIEGDEDSLIRRVFILNDRTAADVMTPLADVVSVQADRTIRQSADTVFRHTYSRYPVFGDTPDDVRGIVRSHDILEALTDGRDKDGISSIMRVPLVVDVALPCDELLVLFRDRSMHLAIVRDGLKTLGLVTLEDVLEELVGEIEDEADADKRTMARTRRPRPRGLRRGNANA